LLFAALFGDGIKQVHSITRFSFRRFQ